MLHFLLDWSPIIGKKRKASRNYKTDTRFFSSSAYLIAAVGIAVNPWQLTATAQTFIAVLNGCVDLSFSFVLSFFVLADKHTDFTSLTGVLIEIQIWHLLRSMLWNSHCRFLDCEKTICQKWVFFLSFPPWAKKVLFVWYGD